MTSLYAPQDYRNATHEQRLKVINGCGPDGFVNRLIPNSICGVDVTEAYNIHDWMVVKAVNSKDRFHADNVFKENLRKLINWNKGPLALRLLRQGIAKIYYWAVLLYSKFKGKKSKHYMHSNRM